MKATHLTIDELCESIRKLAKEAGAVFLDDIPEVLQDDFKLFIRYRGLSETADGRTKISKQDMQEYYEKVMRGDGISYEIKFNTKNMILGSVSEEKIRQAILFGALEAEENEKAFEVRDRIFERLFTKPTLHHLQEYIIELQIEEKSIFPIANFISRNSAMRFEAACVICERLGIKDVDDKRVSTIMDLANKGNQADCIINMLNDEQKARN